MTTIASRTSWKNLPIDNPKRIDIHLQFTAEQFTKLTAGLIPEEMEDKWFVFFENNWLFFHRSWTGYGYYKAQIIKKQDFYIINEFWTERNQEKYQNDDDQADIQILTYLIVRGLLCMDVNYFFARQTIKSGNDAINSWGLFGRMLFTEQSYDNPPE